MTGQMNMHRITGFVSRAGVLLLTLVLLAAFPAFSFGQTPVTEEVVISFEVPRLVAKDLLVRYDGTSVFLPLSEVFTLLELNVNVDPISKRATGFLFSKNDNYDLDFAKFKALIRGKEHPLLASDYVIEASEIYLKLPQFQELFGLAMQFDFSMLRVLLPLNEEFPAYQKLKRKMAREKLDNAEVASKDVRDIPRRHEYFSGGAADWMISANPVGGGGQFMDLNVGAMLLGGDLALSGNGNTVSGFDPGQMTYKWHYCLNPNPFITQVELGKIYSGGSLSRSLDGALVTNRPQIQRSYFQTINLNGRLDPGWEIELYVDNKLTDWATVDEQGNYSFNLDIVYGASLVTLKMYGPNGEIRTEEKYIRVPYNLVPRNTLEYNLAAGYGKQLKSQGTYSQLSGYYGVTRKFTVGVSSDVPVRTTGGEKPSMGGEATYQILGPLTATSSFSPSNLAQFALNYSSQSSMSANGTFTRYFENPIRNALGQLYNVTFSASAPIRIRQKYFGIRYYAAWDKYATFSAISMNYGLSASLTPFYVNYIGKYKISSYVDRTAHQMTSQMLISAEIARWLRPQFRIDYDHQENAITRYGVYFNRRLFRTGQIALSYERNPRSRTNAVMLTFNFFNQVANFTSKMLYSEGRTSVSQVQRGSIRYDRIGSAVRFDRRSSVGYGSCVVRPFLDRDNDGIYTKGDEVLSGLRAKVSGAGGRPQGPNRLWYYDGLRAYDEYLVQVDPTSLDNPMLKPAYENFKIQVSPNVVTTVDVPVVVASDISGMVERQTSDGKLGLGGIRIKVLNISKDIVTDITAFNSGDFYYLGLIPGSYRAYLDPEQLAKYGYVSVPESITFEVKPGDKGTSIENINFLAIPK
jgi:hypothetical protein